jgi:hypothetical protein
MAGTIDSNCAAWSVTGCSEGYHEADFVAGLDLYGSGLSEYPEKIGIHKPPYEDAVIIQNPLSYQVDERRCCKDL